MSNSKIDNLINALQLIPGVGIKTAERYAYDIATSKNNITVELISSLKKIKDEINFCSFCGNFSDNDLCNICLDYSRDVKQLCVVETIRDLLIIESSNSYNGKYFILNGLISPMKNIMPNQTRINELIEISDEFSEIIIALNFTNDGILTSKYIEEKIAKDNISKISMGLPKGGNIIYTDKNTIKHAIENRTSLKKDNNE